MHTPISSLNDNFTASYRDNEKGKYYVISKKDSYTALTRVHNDGTTKEIQSVFLTKEQKQELSEFIISIQELFKKTPAKGGQ